MQTQHSLGWVGPDKVEIVVTNRAGASVAVGACLQLDRRRADGNSTTNVLGTAAAGIANGVTPGAETTDQMSVETFGIVQNSAVNNGKCRLRLQGFVDAVLMSAGSTVTLATCRCVVTPSARTISASVAPQEVNNTATAGVFRKVVFLPHTTVAGGGSTDGWFDGIRGFGTICLLTAP